MLKDMKEKLTRLSGNRLVLAVAAIVFGLLLIIFRRQALDLMIRLMGVALIACACIYYFFYRKGEEHDLLDKAVSIFIGIVGLILIVAARGIVNFFPVIIGIVLIINAFANLARLFSVDAGTRGGGWRGSVVLQIVVLILGFCMMFFRHYAANVIVMFIGVAVLITGISNLVVFIRNRSEGVDDTVGAGTDDGSGSFFGNMRGFFRGGRGSDGSKNDPIDVEYREVGPDDRR